MWPDTRLLDLFGIDLPLVQAPMAGVAGLDMAAAVSEAGGLGSLAGTLLDADGLRDLLTAARAATARPINVNFFAHAEPDPSPEGDTAWLDRLAPYFAELGLTPPETLSAAPVRPFDDARCAVIEALEPAVVSFHFGLPGPELVARVKAAGCRVISSATTVTEAAWLAGRGCDAIIAQGAEAGGHRGMFLTDDIASQIGTLALVPQIVDAVDLPVIAAGGIADGRGIAAALALGAAGVQIGTAYLYTPEATISETYRRAMADAGDTPTAITNVFSGRPARALANRAMVELGPVAGQAAAFPRGFAAVGPLKAKAEEAGSPDFSALYCGQGAGLCGRASAGDLTRRLADGAARRLAGLSAA